MRFIEFQDGTSINVELVTAVRRFYDETQIWVSGSEVPFTVRASYELVMENLFVHQRGAGECHA